tara:strand:- start:1104 stop:1454 length:351 start_codon:yes stop_codon:yes gene_type:complete
MLLSGVYLVIDRSSDIPTALGRAVKVLIPRNGHILIKRWIPEQTTSSGVIIQDDSASYNFGLVVAVHEHFKEEVYGFNIGDVVVVNSESGTSVKWEGEVHLLVGTNDIIAVVGESE